MKVYILIGCLLLLGTHIEAALPPLYQSLNEYKALLVNPQLTEKLTSADLIQSIQRESSSFLIKTNKHTLKIDVIYDPQKSPGPAKYHFVFHEAVPIE